VKIEVDHSKFHPTDDKPPWKGARSGHVTYFKFGGPIISLERLKLES